ncbi:MAG TPA: hypothetical protein VEA59_02645 [Patescibacteria group bacterium]|nr:hypothetical protein [Patescibacteria group bacterium]
MKTLVLQAAVLIICTLVGGMAGAVISRFIFLEYYQKNEEAKRHEVEMVGHPHEVPARLVYYGGIAAGVWIGLYIALSTQWP